MNLNIYHRIIRLAFGIMTGLSTACLAQDGVGIGTLTPNSKSALHIESETKGLIIPRMSTGDRIGMTVTTAHDADGLLVYDTDLGKFCFFNGGSWFVVNPASQVASTLVSNPSGQITFSQSISSSSSITATSISAGSITTGGTVTASNYALNAAGNGPIPQGGIIMWSGTTAPTGWALCDGTNGTPNLSGRFIIGYQSGAATTPADATAYNQLNYGTIGNTGGSAGVTLTVNEMPSHNHTMPSSGAHTHNYSAPSDPGDHPGGDNGYARPNGSVTRTISSSGAHTHTINNQGGGLPHENRPPYYVLAYIIKL